MIGSHYRYPELSCDLQNGVAQQKVVLDMDNIRSARPQKVPNRSLDKKGWRKAEFGIKKKRQRMNPKYSYALSQEALGANASGRANDRSFVTSLRQNHREAVREISRPIHIRRICI